MSDVIRIRNVSKRFGKVQVLDQLNLAVEEGSVYALIGPNGAGKTTTIKLLMNFWKPGAGQAEVLGVDSRHISLRTLRQIGYVSENQEMPDWMTVGYFLDYWKPFYPSWDDARAAELVKQFELPRDRKLRHLSRGMRMKVALASSLAYRPRLLILDEPFSGLDPVMREDLVGGILESAQETSILISSHDLGDIESFASHIGYLTNGRMQFSEEMSSLNERFRAIELVTPEAVTAVPERPAHWLRLEIVNTTVRFIESRFDPERTASEIRRIFGEVRQLSIAPMPLRSIFLALARTQPKTA